MPSIILSNVFDYQAFLDTAFVSYLITQKASEKTIKNYVADVKQFFKWLTGSIEAEIISFATNTTKPLAVITVNIIEQFVQSMIAQMIPTATINRRLSSMRTFFQFATVYDLIDENPMLTIRNISKTIESTSAQTLDDVLALYKKDPLEQPVSDEDLADITEFFDWYATKYTKDKT